MKRSVPYLLCLTAIVTSCNKTPLPTLPPSNDPVYYLSGTVNDDPFDVLVGVGDASITYGISEMNGIDTYYGEVKSESEDFLLRLDVLQPSLMPSVGNEEALIPENGELLVHNPVNLQFRFGNYNQQCDNLLVMNEMGEFEMTNIVSLSEYGVYNIALKFTDVSLKIFEIPVRYGFEAPELNAAFVSNGEGDQCQLFPVGEFPVHQWYVNDLLVSEASYCSVQMPDGINVVRHVIEDADGNSAEHVTLIRYDQGLFLWQLAYVYSAPLIESNYGKCLVSFKRDGVWYKSAIASDNIDKIIYLTAPSILRGQSEVPTLAWFNLAMNVALKDDSQTLSLSLENVEGRMAVGLQ